VQVDRVAHWFSQIVESTMPGPLTVTMTALCAFFMNATGQGLALTCSVPKQAPPAGETTIADVFSTAPGAPIGGCDPPQAPSNAARVQLKACWLKSKLLIMPFLALAEITPTR